MVRKKENPVRQSINPYCMGVAFFCFCLLFAGSNASGLDLATAISMAQENDADFKAKSFEAQAKNADGWALIAAMGPRVAVSGKIMRSRLDYAPEDIAELEAQHLKFNDDSASIILDQPLLDMEKIYRARRGACEMDIAEMDLRKAREELIVRVVERYFSLLAARNALSLAQSKLDILENQQQRASTGHELGLGEQSDLFDIQARYATTSAILAVQEAKVVDAREALAEMLGEAIPGELADLAPESSFSLPHNDEAHWLQQAKKQNVDVRLSRLHTEAARLDGKIGAGRFLPALSFFVEYERTSPDNDLNGYGWDRERTDFGLKLEMELISGGRDFAEFKAREHRYKASRQRLLGTERSITRQIQSTWNTLLRNLETIQAYQKATMANKKSLAVKEANYKEGLQSMLDVLNVQRDYFIVSNRYQNARYDYATTLIRFKQLTGDLNGAETPLMLNMIQ